jgi:16S rRNA (guanine527-N7)-methyltransferase
MPERQHERPLTPQDLAALVPVSRETVERLEVYLVWLRRWQRTINLVAANTLDDPWRRHILDSAQLVRFVPGNATRLVDLGSGAGLPGLVLAIMGVPNVHLIESDRRKAAFLREAARATGAGATVHACRIEEAPALAADIVTARALAPLKDLLGHAHRFATPATRCLLPKGRQVEAELTDAGASWTMEVERQPSLSDADGRILIITGLRRVGSD